MIKEERKLERGSEVTWWTLVLPYIHRKRHMAGESSYHRVVASNFDAGWRKTNSCTSSPNTFRCIAQCLLSFDCNDSCQQGPIVLDEPKKDLSFRTGSTTSPWESHRRGTASYKEIEFRPQIRRKWRSRTTLAHLASFLANRLCPSPMPMKYTS